jgi:hypothetical protein
METKSRHIVWWPTHTFSVELLSCEELNLGLAQLILDHEARTLEVPGSEVAGLTKGLTTQWQTYNVLNWPHRECGLLREILLTGVHDFITQFADPLDPEFQILGIAAWANVLRRGQSLRLHHHDQAFINAHYLVRTGHEADSPAALSEANRNESGYTVYYRPGFIERSHGERHGETLNPWDADWRVSIPATPGRLVFFPSYVRHEVRSYVGEDARISIAFDFYIRKQEPLIYFGGPQWFVP